MPNPNDLPVLVLADSSSWSDWLEQNHATSAGVWLSFAKKGSGSVSLNYAQALEIALCYGWIDGQKKAYDALAWLQRFTPRRAKSIWSKINREKALQLIEQGQMKPAGFAAIEVAKKNGQWEAAYDPQSKASVPEDLQAELDHSPTARAFFATLNSTNRYAILFRVQTAKKPETRLKLIRQLVKMLEKGQKIYP